MDAYTRLNATVIDKDGNVAVKMTSTPKMVVEAIEKWLRYSDGDKGCMNIFTVKGRNFYTFETIQEFVKNHAQKQRDLNNEIRRLAPKRLW